MTGSATTPLLFLATNFEPLKLPRENHAEEQAGFDVMPAEVTEVIAAVTLVTTMSWLFGFAMLTFRVAGRPGATWPVTAPERVIG
jgi:hypothetical protein